MTAASSKQGAKFTHLCTGHLFSRRTPTVDGRVVEDVTWGELPLPVYANDPKQDNMAVLVAIITHLRWDEDELWMLGATGYPGVKVGQSNGMGADVLFDSEPAVDGEHIVWPSGRVMGAHLYLDGRNAPAFPGTELIVISTLEQAADVLKRTETGRQP